MISELHLTTALHPSHMLHLFLNVHIAQSKKHVLLSFFCHTLLHNNRSYFKCTAQKTFCSMVVIINLYGQSNLHTVRLFFQAHSVGQNGELH